MIYLGLVDLSYVPNEKDALDDVMQWFEEKAKELRAIKADGLEVDFGDLFIEGYEIAVPFYTDNPMMAKKYDMDEYLTDEELLELEEEGESGGYICKDCAEKLMGS